MNNASKIGKHGNHAKGIRVDRIAVACQHCGKERLFLPSFLKVHPIKFCSKKCEGESRKNKVQVECGTCGVLTLKRPGLIKKVNYCSLKCSGLSKKVDGAKWRNPEKIKEYMRDYVQANKEKLYKKSASRDRENPVAKKKRSEKYRKKNKASIAVLRRMRKKQLVVGDLTTEQWSSVLEKYNYTCLCCGKKEPEILITLDHIVPLSKGGEHTLSNVQPLCKSCNSSKNVKAIDYRRNPA